MMMRMTLEAMSQELLTASGNGGAWVTRDISAPKGRAEWLRSTRREP
uniref:Uncharacterized protein n=1 Tax=Arabidopsis thaliana TaxID=3702 RepID=Q570X0_ARATH|nr:hypothetical protein [Arabidopsis thaliana]